MEDETTTDPVRKPERLLVYPFVEITYVDGTDDTDGTV
jgi:hypothetical protein